MAESATKLYLDLTNSQFVESDSQPNPLGALTVFAGDSRAFLIKPLRRVSAISMTALDLTGVTLRMGIGIPAYAPAVFASGTSSAGDENGFLPVSMDLSAAATQTALGALDMVNASLEIRLIGCADPFRVAMPCILRQRLLT